MVNISPAHRAADPNFAALVDLCNQALEICAVNATTIANLNEALECWKNVAAMREAENATLRARLAAAPRRAA